MYLFLLFNVLSVMIYMLEVIVLQSQYIIMLNVFTILLRQAGYLSKSKFYLVIVTLLFPIKIYLIISYVNVILLITKEVILMICYNSLILYRNLLLIDKEKLYKNLITSCSICLENFKEEDKVILTECSHLYHHECLTKWFEKNNSCPICRKENLVINIDN